MLAYRVLKSANISPGKEQLARATITELKYEAMKKQILKIFDETCLTKSSSPPVEVKVEDAFYSNSFRGRRFYRGRGRGGRGEAPGRRYANQSVKQNKGEQPQNKSVKVKNPLDANGFVTKCMVCRSIYHWFKDCPDRNAMYTACHEEEVHITLFSKTVQECYAENFLGETLSYAILDSGCTKSVCSRVWLQCYLDALNESDKSSVQEQESSSKFKFGDGALQTSLKKVIIPADINGTKVKIETDVIDNNLPLLLSKSAMQKAATKIDFKNNKVTMFGKVQDLHFTTSGHYCIPLDRKHKIINYEDQNATKVMFTNTLDNKTSQEKKSVAMKLHKQFCHPRTFRLRKLLQDGGVNDEEFFKLIEEVEKTCDICCKYKRPPSKPIVCFPLSKEFNELVAMDIKYCENHLVLHLIDHATRFSSAAIIRSKRKDTINSKVFQI